MYVYVCTLVLIDLIDNSEQIRLVVDLYDICSSNNFSKHKRESFRSGDTTLN